MRIFVTLLASLFGFLVAHIPGALLGLLVGSIIDHRLSLKSWQDLRDRLPVFAQPHISAQQVLFMLLGHLAKSTGRVTAEHIQAARFEMQRLLLTDAAQKVAIAAFARGKACRLHELRGSLKLHYSTAEQTEKLLMAGWRMALAEGMPTAKQRRILHQCAQWLACPEDRFCRIEAQALRGRLRPLRQRDELQAALELLGVSRADTWPQVKKAYRRQISAFHPDKLMGAGATLAQLDAATEKTRALHQAYEVARKHWAKSSVSNHI
ncbi:molecular chaperone DjlA [Denitrificimonas sp. JX-1]|uniref:Molecular chaperone DjlA n=1 Tax=Denitrificimonas halotolerans TaxID=3098930 RepID=A0ABU5GT82_9GAMM|nr:molecular chaperone DjlA [Denitrificimonas sp. JX-1]MDY7219910.1 molecular chaperone DjlA [Denitrificimonas sp. JX-1]